MQRFYLACVSNHTHGAIRIMLPHAVQLVTVSNYETFSKRLKKREQAGQHDVYQYDDLPKPLRIQIIHIWDSAIGAAVLRISGRHTAGPRPVWDLIHDQVARELGVRYLGDNPHADPKVRCERFLLNASTNEALDIIELSFRGIQIRVARI
jgi:hypothetical protein